MKKNQFIKVTDVEQNLFEKLSGQIDKVLLLYTNELKEGEEEYLEYYFTYSDATAENFGLETFYAKVKKTSKKNLTSNDLLSKAVSRLTEKMVKRNLDDDNVRDEAPVELSMTSSSLEAPIINNQNYGSSQKITSVEETIIAAEDYSTKSQATYFFDCNGDGTTKGSFCCMLSNGTEYFILTAWHNLGKGTEIGTNYFLKGPSEIKLELRKYSEDYDYAILKISDNKIIPNTIPATVDTGFVQKVKEVPKNGNLVAYQNVATEIKNGKYIQDGGDKKDGKFAIDGAGNRGNSGGAIVYMDKVMGMYTNVTGNENQAITIDFILKDATGYEVV